MVGKTRKISKKSYHIHDNGGRPFTVVVEGRTVTIFKEGSADPFATYKVKKVFPGKSSGKCYGSDHDPETASQFTGNSVLLQLSATHYVYIGHEIYEFTMEDPLVKYYSLVGHSDVPYPVALGKENVYFMLDKKYVPRSKFPEETPWEDAYQSYYGTWDTKKKKWVDSMEDLAHKMKGFKLIHKRVF
jgi:hypothetical protein